MFEILDLFLTLLISQVDPDKSHDEFMRAASKYGIYLYAYLEPEGLKV